MVKYLTVAFSVILLIGSGIAVQAQTEDADIPTVFKTPEALVVNMYKSVSSEKGSTPDWNLVKSHFHPDAVVVLRVSRTESKKYDLNGFIQDFVDFYKRIDPQQRGFKETVVSVKTMAYGNIAHCYVVYEAAVSPSNRPPQRGLDSWHLVHMNNRWMVISVVNEIELAAGPTPREVFKINNNQGKIKNQ